MIGLKFVKIFLVILFVSTSLMADDLEKAKAIYDKALSEVDKKNYDEAIKLFDKALKISPDNLSLLYEKGFAYYLKRDFKTAIVIFKDLLIKNIQEPNCYILLGNSLDYEDHLDSARIVYNLGISKFPSNGALYYQLGNSYVGRGPMADASAQWELGVQNDPGYPNNYFQLAKYYSKIADKLWSVIYGELFLNISDNAERSKEMSNLLYNTYKEALFYKKDTTVSVKFTNINIVYNKDSVKRDLPFAVNYQNTMVTAFEESKISDIDQYSIESLTEIRKEFIDTWFLNKLDKKFTNILFDKHKKMIEDSVFLAYNYWLFREANPDEFKKWISKKENIIAFKKFNNWFVDNPENMSMGHFFTRFMYDYMINNLEFKNK